MISGSCPTRSATGGSLPALTSAASCGASLSCLGSFAGSVTTCGRSSLPIKEPLEATCARAPAATRQTRAPTTKVTVNRDRSVRRCFAIECFPFHTCSGRGARAFSQALVGPLRPLDGGLVLPREIDGPRPWRAGPRLSGYSVAKSRLLRSGGAGGGRRLGGRMLDDDVGREERLGRSARAL